MKFIRVDMTEGTMAVEEVPDDVQGLGRQGIDVHHDQPGGSS